MIDQSTKPRDERVREVVVMGGGPAGSTVANLLAQAGHDVVVLLDSDARKMTQAGQMQGSAAAATPPNDSKPGAGQ